ncbi:serine racemase-like [Anneissia japonica]|uniref:serine racemase-like n=1 Tax=Anneissia japonica TaxID=1529436 RepID=UPI00142553B9|nr:serine racemase-like [Anneissia japonica]
MVEVSTNKIYGVAFEDIQQAHQRIKGHVNMTPVMTFDYFDKLVPCKLHFKCESFQKTGSFKFRGAFNSVSKLVEKISPDDLSVLAHSSGNHGQALALAAKLCNVKANIVMPTNAPLCKVEAVKGYGATVISCASTEKAREEKAKEVIKETNGYMVHSSQNPEVIAGQGTIALEFLQQVPNLDAIVATVGGGGLLSGICLAAKALKPSIKIYAAEPEMADDCARSMKANRHLKNETYPDTVADGLRVSIGEATWPILRDHLDDVILVTEEEICDNLRLVLEKAKLFVEPSAAVGVAAVRSSHFKRLIDEHQLTQVGVVLCGGNIDADKLKTII